MKNKKRPSKLDLVAAGIAQEYAHTSTADIMRLQVVVSCELNVAEGEIVSLQARLATAKSVRADAEARLQGLASVVGKR